MSDLIQESRSFYSSSISSRTKRGSHFGKEIGASSLFMRIGGNNYFEIIFF